jgi:CheY-like chemotaxis protein
VRIPPRTDRNGLRKRDGDTRLHVLLVEDHADSARVLVRLLGAIGYTVTHARDVASAREAARAGFDLLISDLGLPDGTGHDLMRELCRERPVRGIALSGYGMESDLSRSRDAGFQEHLTKPVNIEQLRAAIERVAAPSAARAGNVRR